MNLIKETPSIKWKVKNNNIIQTPPYYNDPQKKFPHAMWQNNKVVKVLDIIVGEMCPVIITLCCTALHKTSHLVHSFCAYGHFWKMLLMHLLACAMDYYYEKSTRISCWILVVDCSSLSISVASYVNTQKPFSRSNNGRKRRKMKEEGVLWYFEFVTKQCLILGCQWWWPILQLAMCL